jgi:catechol-2,3-dioxygenase
MTDADTSRARLVGINHVALEVGDLEAALEFYGAIFEFDLRGRSESGAFLDMGDQFLALTEKDESIDESDDHRHFGLVVDDLATVERRLEELDVERLSTTGLDFRDPWGNRIQIVAYEDIQFTKANHILRAMELSGLEKSESALNELSDKGMAPE